MLNNEFFCATFTQLLLSREKTFLVNFIIMGRCLVRWQLDSQEEMRTSRPSITSSLGLSLFDHLFTILERDKIRVFIGPKYFQVRQNVPRVSYVSLLDIWMLVCMIFVFACILEFIVITVYIRSGKKMLGEKVKLASEKVGKQCIEDFANV